MLGLSTGLVYTMKAGSAWDVTSIGGLAHWFKRDTNITLSTGAEVSKWAAEYGNEALGLDDGKVLVNESGDLDFKTNNGRMDLNSNFAPLTFSFYFVAKITAEEISNEEIFHSNSSNFFRVNRADAVRVRIGDTTNNDISLPGDDLTSGQWFVLGIEFDGSEIAIYQDTDYEDPGTALDSDSFGGLQKIGKRGNNFDGEIREIILVNNVLSVADREKLMEYLITVRDI